MTFTEICLLALGCAYAGLGLFWLGKFGGQLTHPPDEDNRRARLPFVLMTGRFLGVGGGFIAFGLTGSLIGFAFGVALLMSDVAIYRWSLRRLGALLE